MKANVIDISTLGAVSRDKITIYGLVSGQKIIAEQTSENPLKIKNAYNLILRPVSQNQLSIELMDLVIGIDDRETPEISLNENGVLFRYKPDGQLLENYAGHVAARSK